MFPEYGFVREAQVLSVFPVSRAQLWKLIKQDKFPAPLKLSPNVTVWRAEQIRALVDRLSARD